MTVPETTMYKDHLPAGVEHEIWFSREVFPMKPVPVSEAMNN
jgi:hypothetical protein